MTKLCCCLLGRGSRHGGQHSAVPEAAIADLAARLAQAVLVQPEAAGAGAGAGAMKQQGQGAGAGRGNEESVFTLQAVACAQAVTASYNQAACTHSHMHAPVEARVLQPATHLHLPPLKQGPGVGVLPTTRGPSSLPQCM